MENINEALKLIANALELMRNPEALDIVNFQKAIDYLEQAVDKLAK